VVVVVVVSVESVVESVVDDSLESVVVVVKPVVVVSVVVVSVVVVAAAPVVMADGAAAYQAYGVGRSRGTQVFQLAGNIARGGIVELPFGVTLGELVDGYGGGTRSGRPVRTVQVGAASARRAGWARCAARKPSTRSSPTSTARRTSSCSRTSAS
jgi:hypothetical protein